MTGIRPPDQTEHSTGERRAVSRPATDPDRVSRRALLGTGALAVAAFAGCLGTGTDDAENDSGTNTSNAANGTGNGTSETRGRPVVQDPPDAVYTPTHRAPVEMVGMVEAGEYTLMPHFSLPHRFWLVRGDGIEAVPPKIDDSIHLMMAFWDGDTGSLVPVDIGAQVTIRQGGETVTRVAPWAMISQQMGFHLGDNVALPGDGTYTAEITIPSIESDQVRKTGAFAGRFEETQTATVEFEYSTEMSQQMSNNVTYTEERRWGDPGAIEPMSGMGRMPAPSLAPASEYPGQSVLTPDGGTPTSGDARFVVRYLPASRLADGGGYLLVSPRTPYNRIPLPEMALSLAGGREGDLTQTLDGTLGLHYGTALSLAPGETFEIAVESPPQLARHQGYETAFFEMDTMTVQVPDQ
jgi:hypothetical protein